ncbi:MAG: SIMPL domain-containing protein [Dehalococcoidales bacterium]|nr:SIMPL domain-containing protein [Dehalococcoidales bacterium]
MKRKWLVLIALALVSILAVTALAGCAGPVAAQGTPSTVQISQQPQGIWVSGTGEVAVTPDIAVLRLGIVAQETTVAVAQSKASEAMTKVMKALTDGGIAQKDIQTGSFSINQRTRWDDQKQMETVTGYQVTNMVTVKIRKTDKVGDIIDSVVQAGGDLIRINGINFSVDDPANYYQQAREKAMADAKKKAEQLASLAGVSLGKPTYVAEGAQMSPVYSSSMGMAIPAPTIITSAPPISAGETKITLNVQVAYSVNQ